MSLENLQLVKESYEEARQAYEEKAAEVKKFHNEIYAPMCDEKRRLKAEFEAAELELKAALKENEALLEVVRGMSRKR